MQSEAEGDDQDNLMAVLLLVFLGGEFEGCAVYLRSIFGFGAFMNQDRQ